MSSSDRFRIVTFNDQATDFTRGYIPATRENVVQTLEKIKKIQAGGGTALYAGMEKGYEGLDEDRISGIILVTDGVANVGLSQHADLLKLHRAHDFGCLRLSSATVPTSRFWKPWPQNPAVLP